MEVKLYVKKEDGSGYELTISIPAQPHPTVIVWQGRTFVWRNAEQMYVEEICYTCL